MENTMLINNFDFNYDMERFDVAFNHIYDLVAAKIGKDKASEQIDAVLGATIQAIGVVDY